MGKKKFKLPVSNDWQMDYDWYDIGKTRIAAKMRYDCGCEYTMILDKNGKTLEFDMGDTIWCESHDPTMPWVEEYDYENKEWKEEK